MAPALQIVTGASTIGGFVFQGIGLGHLLKDNPKHPAVILEEARQELSSALNILTTFQAFIHNDFMAPLAGRYNM